MVELILKIINRAQKVGGHLNGLCQKLSSFCAKIIKKSCLIVERNYRNLFNFNINKNVKYIGIPNNSCIHLPITIKLANCVPIFWILIKITTQGKHKSFKKLRSIV